MTARLHRLRWISGGMTDRGRIREVNQDAYLDRPDLGLWAVADGMGGHSEGGMASRLLVERLAGLNRPHLLGAAAVRVRGMIQEINGRLVQDAASLGGDVIGTTIVAVVAVGDHCAILWAGDSRAYRLRRGELVQLTLDHTHVQEMVSLGMLTPEQADLHPLANVLARAVGGEPALQVDCRVEALRDGDRYLLCSDGLVKELSVTEIIPILARTEPPVTAQALVREACAAGGRDNVTAVVMDFHA